ncbi:SDR family oxidoreductase [Dyadobacter sp. CY261]|uniref:SDR family oxidoreductase n=1 Tax=Dyadobacter sp. CY261 TaxID=2907203 RepID=UPI001F3135A6|nr:SDR family oxidoreductase [Dyadobacter sp. CY261]MCF0074224.1 SDR family oxidoreductase [Dyadobacter sp. CY261]
MKQTSIFLTGATGSVGSQLVQKLTSLNIPFKALVRTASQAEHLGKIPHAEMVVGDLANPESFEHALQGIEKTFLLTNSSEQAESLQTGFVEAAHRAGVGHIVKLSQFAANESSPVRFLRYHAKVENRIRELGFRYTFLRPNLYMQGLLAFKEQIRDNAHFFAAIGNARVSAVDVRDIAAMAAVALTEAGHENKTYDITGPEPLTHYQMAETLSKTLGKPVNFISVSPSEMEEALRAAGFPEWQVGGLIEDYAHYARGEAATVSDAIARTTHQSAITFEQFVQDHKFLFQPRP